MIEVVLQLLGSLCEGGGAGCGCFGGSGQTAANEILTIEEQLEKVQAQAAGDVNLAIKVFAGVEIILGGLLLLDGFGPPDKGENFDDGGDDFDDGNTESSTDVKSILSGAMPDGKSWSGKAADYYKSLNDRLLGLAEDMAVVDRTIGNVLKARSPGIVDLRYTFGYLEAATAGAGLVAAAMYKKYQAACAALNWEAAARWAVTLKRFVWMVAISILTAACVESIKLKESDEKSKTNLTEMSGKYQYIAGLASATIAPAITPGPLPAQQSTVSDSSDPAKLFVDNTAESELVGAVDASADSAAMVQPDDAPKQAATVSGQVWSAPNLATRVNQQPAAQVPRFVTKPKQTPPAAPARADHGNAPTKTATNDGFSDRDADQGLPPTPGVPSDLAAMTEPEQLLEPALAQSMGFS